MHNGVTPAQENGSAILVILALLGLIAIFLAVSLKTNPQIERDKISSDALAQARDALLGYALRGDDGLSPSRPGVFPCPDNHVPTDASNPQSDPLYGTSSTPCSDGTIGRLPWRTLKIPELLDNSGTPIWYALSGSFTTSAGVINSDSKGTLQVRASDGTTLQTALGSEATAILFAPGAALAGQSRSTAVEITSAANYLETSASINNAVGTLLSGNCSVQNQGGTVQTSCHTFITGTRTSSFNDRLLYISPRDFIPQLDRRTGKIAESALSGYFATCGYYPRPALFSNTACLPGGSTNGCIPDSTATQGRFPYYAKTDPADFTMVDWAGLPNWFLANRWDRVIYYAVATGYTVNAPSQTCPGNCLSVDSDTSVRRLIIMPGNPTGATNGRPSSTLAQYLEDSANIDLNTAFITPTSAANDQLFKHPRSGVTPDTSSIYSPSNPNPACSGASSPSTDLGSSILDALGLTDPPPGGDTGQTSITLPDGTVVSSASLGTGTITVTNSGVGVESAWGPPAVSILESLSFTFPTTRNKLALYVNKLNSSEFALLTFYNGGTPIGTTYIQGCANSGAVFDNISLSGSPAFTSVTVAPLSIGGIYILGIKACTGTDDCSITGTGATTCSWP